MKTSRIALAAVLFAHKRRIASQEGAVETATPPWLAWTGLARMETVPAMEPGRSVSVRPSRTAQRPVSRPLSLQARHETQPL